MKTEIFEWGGEQPPAIASLIGLKVVRMWQLPDGLFILLNGRQALKIHPVESVGDFIALSLEVGDVKESADWSKFDEMVPQTPYTEAIRGTAFTGIDANVVMFGDRGAKITREGLQWVKAGHHDQDGLV